MQMLRSIAVLILSASACLAQNAGAKPVELSGVVGQIHIVPGQGMPYFELRRGAETTKVRLGPMFYLIAINFNPKSGQEVVVKGHRLEEWVIAWQITLSPEKRNFQFRDDQGRPLWRGRGRGGQAQEF
jgi:hypothetical protein